MKGKAWIAVIQVLVFAAGAGWLLLEHRACTKIRAENAALRSRFNEALNRLVETQPFSSPDRTGSPAESVPAVAASAVRLLPIAEEEALRLRNEISGLLQQHQQSESLREDTRQTLTVLENRRKEDRAARRAASRNQSQLEITKAEYWTEHASLDVTEELQDRIRGDNLKAMANNDLKGDPEFGQTKHLRVEYKFGGVTRTNEFREGDVIALPAEPERRTGN